MCTSTQFRYCYNAKDTVLSVIELPRSAKTASKCKLDSLLRMLYSKLTILYVTLAQWTPLDSYIWVPVAWVTVVSVSEAEEQGCVTAVSALIVDELVSVNVAVSHASTNLLCCALTANKLFSVDLSLVVVVSTVLKTSEVRLLALVAVVEGTLEHGK